MFIVYASFQFPTAFFIIFVIWRLEKSASKSEKKCSKPPHQPALSKVDGKRKVDDSKSANNNTDDDDDDIVMTSSSKMKTVPLKTEDEKKCNNAKAWSYFL